MSRDEFTKTHMYVKSGSTLEIWTSAKQCSMLYQIVI